MLLVSDIKRAREALEKKERAAKAARDQAPPGTYEVGTQCLLPCMCARLSLNQDLASPLRESIMKYLHVMQAPATEHDRAVRDAIAWADQALQRLYAGHRTTAQGYGQLPACPHQAAVNNLLLDSMLMIAGWCAWHQWLSSSHLQNSTALARHDPTCHDLLLAGQAEAISDYHT